MFGSGLVVFLAVAFLVYQAVRIPLPANIAEPEQIRVTYADGSPLGNIGSFNRTEVSLSAVPVPVQDAVLAAEDRNYLHEPGVSVRGIARALVADVTAGKISQGGSTITQQYAKNAYLGQQRTFSRKIKEVVLAIKLSHKFSKQQILQDYLNTIYFGRGAYGIEAASKAYFGVHVASLDVAQGAVLAGLIREPSYLDPRLHPKSSLTRWNEVLSTMVSQKWLTATQRAALVYPATIPRRELASPQSGPVGVVDAQVAAFLHAKFGDSAVALGGLTVTTTLSPTAERAALDAVAAHTAGAPAGLRVALESIDPTTGAIRAYYGGASTAQPDAVSYLTAPPGSSFKPIVLAAALRSGTRLTTTFDGSSPQTFGGTTVHNFDGEQFGRINLITATANSVNTVYVALNIATGPQQVADLAHVLGIPSSVTLNPVGTMALGEDYVHAADMAEVYATFADDGVQATPYLVDRVVDRKGRVLYQAHPSRVRVLPSSVARDATYALQRVLTEGTAAGAGLTGRESAGKTGTTDGNVSAWFDGYTPQLATVVGIFDPTSGGHLQSLVPWSGCGCAQVTGGTVPAHLWQAYMNAALAGTPAVPFPAVAGAPAASLTPTSTSPAPTSSSPSLVPSSNSPVPTSSSIVPSTSTPPVTASLPLGSSGSSSGSPSATPSATPSGTPDSSASGAPTAPAAAERRRDGSIAG